MERADGSEGFGEFVIARGPALSRSAYLLTGDHQLAEDLLQAALARAAPHWHRIATGNPEAYVRRVMLKRTHVVVAAAPLLGGGAYLRGSARRRRGSQLPGPHR